MRRLLITAAIAALCAAAPGLAAQSAESKACSADATAKGLHGKDRETFMDSCKKAATPAAAAAPAKAVKEPKAAKTAPMAAVAPAPAKPVVAAKAAAAPAATAATKGFAPKSDASKACSDQATAKGLHGKERETFRDACLKGAPAPMAAVKPAAPKAAVAPMAPIAPAKAAAPAAAAKPSIFGGLFGAKPAAEATPPEPTAASAKAAPAGVSADGKPRTANQLAADARIKRCGAMWQADKAAGKTTGQTWPKYWSACSAKLKAAA